MISKNLTFTFNHKDQRDKLYEVMTSQDIKNNFDTRSENLRDYIYTIIDDLNSATGSQNIGYKATTVYSQLNTIDSEILAAREGNASLLANFTAIRSLISGKADTSHTHSGYASSTHNHDGSYSLTSHTHSGFAATSHNHDASYSLTSHTHSGFAATSHTHTLANITDYVAYSLPTATASVLGGVKVGSGLSITAGVLSATYTYTLPTASATTLGGVKAGNNITIDANGVISSTAVPGGTHEHTNLTALNSITSQNINDWNDNKDETETARTSGNSGFVYQFLGDRIDEIEFNTSKALLDSSNNTSQIAEITQQVNTNKTDIVGLQTSIGTKVNQSYVDEAIKGVTAGTAEISGLSRNGSSIGKKNHTIRNPVKPCISFTDDDGKVGVYTKWKNIMQSKGVPISICVNSGRVGNNGYMTWEQLRDLQNTYGCEMLSHTSLHTTFPTMYDSEIIQDLKSSKEVMMKNGLKVTGFAYPSGNYYSKDKGDDVSYLCAKEYDYAVITMNSINTYPISNSMKIDRCAIGCYEGTGFDTLDGIKAKINECIAQNGWLIFMTHVDDVAHTDEDTTNLGLIIDYIKSLGTAEIVTLQDGYKRFGNVIESAKGQLTNQGDLFGIGGGSGGSYNLPTASSTVLGGIKVGSGLSITNGVLSSNGGADLSNYYNRSEVDYYITQLSDRITVLEGGTVEIYGQIVINKTTTTITEGGTDTFTVSLSQAPTNNQIVTLSKDNSDITLSATSLTFTPSNYNTAQTVTITVAEDNTDYSNETCTITLTSPNVTTKTLTVNITDNDTAPSGGIPTEGLQINLNTVSGSGNTVIDSISNAVFTLNAMDGVNGGFINGGLQFDGYNDMLTTPHSDILNEDGVKDFTYSITLKQLVTPTATQWYFCKFNLSAYGVNLAISSQLKVVFEFQGADGSWGNSITSSSAIAINTINNITVTKIGQIYKLFINGVEVGTKTITKGIITNNTSFVIGAKTTNMASPSNMIMYNFVKYNRGLSDAEVTTLSTELKSGLI